MADPLGLIGSSGSIGPIRPGKLPAGGEPNDPNAPSFKDALLKELRSVSELQQDATHAVEDLAVGRRDDIETVLKATADADTAFRMLLQVRNKMMDAYDELKQIRV